MTATRHPPHLDLLVCGDARGTLTVLPRSPCAATPRTVFTPHMKDQLDDWELALLVESRSLENPTVVESAAADAYRDHRDIVDDAADAESPVVVERDDAQKLDRADSLLDAASGIDDPKVVDESEWEATQEACSAVEALLSDALKEQNGLKDSVVDAMSAKDMVAQFEDDDGDLTVDALAQTPETGGDPGDDGGDGGDGGADPSDLSAEDRQDVKDKLRRADLMDGRTDDHAERLRQEAASIVGVDDADDIDLEVL